MSDYSSRPMDATWVRGLFGLAPNMRDRRLLNLRTYSNATMSFADTTVGGGQAINTPPQFTRFADPALGGLFANPYNRSRSDGQAWYESEQAKGSYRLGAYYQETIEENSFYMHCRFGKPKYTGVVAFFANMYDSKLAYLARTGDYPGIIRTVSTYITAGAVWAVMGTLGFAALLIIPRVLKMALNKQSSSYYYLKPAMHLYLRAVQTILNTQLLHRRLVPMWGLDLFGSRYITPDNEESKYNGSIDELYAGLPDIWKSNGEFDVYKMINRYQTLANYQAKTLDQIYKKTAETGDQKSQAEAFDAKLKQFYSTAKFSDQLRNAVPDGWTKGELSLRDLEKFHLENSGYAVDQAQLNNELSAAEVKDILRDNYNENATDGITETTGQAAAESTGPTQVSAEEIDKMITEGKSMGTLFDKFVEGAEQAVRSFTSQQASELMDGAQWITWRIDAKDTTSKSWSNSTKEPEISGTVNGVTAMTRSFETNTSGGKLGIGLIDGAIEGLKDVFKGALDTLHLTGLAALYNQSVIDFPEVWDSSDVSGDDYSFTIQCRAWSGNDLDVFQDVIIPIAFWLAAVCPLSTGKQSFTHPFYLEAYSRGRFAFRNAMVTNVSMNFGVGNYGWRRDGVPLSVDINITIKDLSRAMHMPLVQNTDTFDDDNKFSDFMATLGAASLHERTRGLEKMAMNLNKWRMGWKSFFTISNFSNSISDLPPARILAGFLGGATR